MSNKLNLTQDEIIKALEFGLKSQNEVFMRGIMAGVKAGVDPDEQLAPAWVKNALGKKYDKRVKEYEISSSVYTVAMTFPSNTWNTSNDSTKA